MQINEGRIYFGRSISHHNMDDGFNYFYIVEIILLDWQQCWSCFWFSLTDDVKKTVRLATSETDSHVLACSFEF